MGTRKVTKNKEKGEKETKFDKTLDFIQLFFGLILIIYGMFRNNNIALGIGGMLLLFCRREISFPFKKK